VPAGVYNITAKATDNSNYTRISPVVKLLVNINNSTGFCGTLANGDYSYKAETSNGNVVFTFHPLTPIAGCGYALIYVREGASGGYPGYQMTALGSDFRFTKPIANGVQLSIYFTYQVPAGGERNSSATPHSYTVGTNCLIAPVPVSLLNFSAALQVDGNVAVRWSTASEINNDYFLLEKSNDGILFSLLEKISGSNLSVTVKNYQTVDKYPLAGTNYYRLTQVDKDGKKTIYGVRTVSVTRGRQYLSIHPNPVQNKRLNIHFNDLPGPTLHYKILGADSRVIVAGSIASQNGRLGIVLPSSVNPGVYMLAVDGFTPIQFVVE